MLLRHRRMFSVVAFLLLAAPLAVGIVRPDSPALILKEGRYPAPAPARPDGPGDWLKLPKQIDAYLSDHFGLRERMIRLHRDLTHPVLLKVNTAVLTGRSGRMFYQGNEMVRQSAGLVLRDVRVTQTARFIAEMRDALAERGIRFLVAIPPNSSTIYQDDLPGWAQDKGKTTEYDLLLEELKGYGVKTVDLRPPLTALRAKGEEAYLLYDAHWTPRGALAGYNAVVKADGPPSWRLDPAAGIGTAEEPKGGDVARILGVQDEVSEEAKPLTLKLQGKDEDISPGIMPDHDGDRRFVHPRLFPADAVAAWRRPRDLDSSSRMRIRVEADRQISPRRGLVGADRAVPPLRSRRRADWFQEGRPMTGGRSFAPDRT